MKQDKPNIIFVMADQLAASAMGCYGCKVNATPNIDKLAEEGAMFKRNYSVNPVCGAARASIFTGREASRTGVYYNNIDMSPELIHFTNFLKDDGYKTGGFGKFHFTDMQKPLPEDMSAFGFDKSVISDDTKYGKWLEWIKQDHPEYYEKALALTWPRNFDTPEDRENYKSAFEKEMNGRINSPYDAITYVSPLPTELHQTTYITDQSIDFIEQSSKSDDPFMCYISYVDPHDPYDPPEPYASMFSPDDIPRPVDAEWLDCPPPGYSEIINDPREFKFQNNIVPLRDYSMQDWQKMRAHFFGSVKFIDDQLGRIIAFLKQKGIENNTVIIFTTDHGEMIGDHKLVTKGIKHYDSGIRTPLIIHAPFINGSSGLSVKSLTCNLDIYPTICEFAGIDISKFCLDGYSLLPFFTDSNYNPHKNILIQYEESNENRCARTIISEDYYRLSIFPGQNYGEMFDLKNDPDEQDNLYKNPVWKDKKMELMEKMIFEINKFIHSAYGDITVNMPVEKQIKWANIENKN